MRKWLWIAGLVSAVALVGAYLAWGHRPCRSLRDAMYNAAACYTTLQVTYVDKTPNAGTPFGTVEIIRQPGMGAWARHYQADGPVVEYRTDGTIYEVWQGGRRTGAMPQSPPRRGLFGNSLDDLKRLFIGPPGSRQAYLTDPEELPLGLIYSMTFPSSFVTEIYDKSTVTDLGPEPMLGRDTEKLVVANKYSEVYTVNVDRQTGVILRWDLRIQGGPPVIWEATRVVVDQAVDTSLFQVGPLPPPLTIQGSSGN